MIFHNEKQIIKIIKYAPSIFIFVVSITIISALYFQNNRTFKKEKQLIEQEFKQKNKDLIKEEVNAVYEYIQKEQKSTEDELKLSLKEAVNNALAIAKSLYENNPHKSKQEIKKLIVDALKNVTFNKGRGYYFIYDKKGRNVMLPFSPELEGKNFINHQDAKGTYIIQDMLKLLSKSDDTFYEWYWYKPKDLTQQRKKIGYVRNFKALDWFIGTGEYVEDFEKEVQNKLLKHIQDIRYGNNGYIFIIDYNTIYLSHIKQDYLGKSAIENNDTIAIKKVISDLIEIAKKGDGYYSYVQNEKPDTLLSTEKISYVKGLQNWSWMIGSGFYVDDINKIILQKKSELDNEFHLYIKNTIRIGSLLTFLLLLLSIYFSKKLQKKFEEYKDAIQVHLIHNEKQQNLLAQQSKMASMGEMIANIAHQWRQPLSTITTSATGMLVQEELKVLEDKDLRNGLETINKSAIYLSNTIDDFRNFFKTTKTKSCFNIKNSIEQAISLVSVQFYNKNITIIKDIHDIELNNCENEFIQVLINLLNNSRDELEKKSVTDKKFIFIKTEKNKKNEVIITVKDNAGGIPTSIMTRIFEPYFTTKQKAQGTGIGLYMCQEIVSKNMCGSIIADNEEFIYEKSTYTGAAFKIILPLECKI
ncbi:MAG: cache domain-containing protein [Candidatus Marinarcus sp.]|uniref:sensor histidine kinase n=1 Tax=Candidatus Marinarcus sp. TaxID=3100987 RepID=UPI003B00019D